MQLVVGDSRKFDARSHPVSMSENRTDCPATGQYNTRSSTMRRCAIHGTENNCSAFVAGGNCNGILHGTEADDAPLRNPRPQVHDAEEAQQRLGDFAAIVEGDDEHMVESIRRYEEDLARLVMAGHSESNAIVLLAAPGSPWHGFAEYRVAVEGARNARAAESAEAARIASLSAATDAEVTPEQPLAPLPEWVKAATEPRQ